MSYSIPSSAPKPFSTKYSSYLCHIPFPALHPNHPVPNTLHICVIFHSQLCTQTIQCQILFIFVSYSIPSSAPKPSSAKYSSYLCHIPFPALHPNHPVPNTLHICVIFHSQLCTQTIQCQIRCFPIIFSSCRYCFCIVISFPKVTRGFYNILHICIGCAITFTPRNACKLNLSNTLLYDADFLLRLTPEKRCHYIIFAVFLLFLLQTERQTTAHSYFLLKKSRTSLFHFLSLC